MICPIFGAETNERGFQMIRKFKIQPSKTYATEENADKAVLQKGFSNLRYFIMKNEDNRFFPVFVGMEAMERGVHFHFNIVA